jgi:hypothetical protein
MELTGKLIELLPEVKGTSSKGEWVKRDAIIETLETYPKRVCISFWNDLIKVVTPLSTNTELTAHINIESREYNGRWYTEVKAWKVDVKGAKPAENKSETAAPEPIINDENPDNLPF